MNAMDGAALSQARSGWSTARKRARRRRVLRGFPWALRSLMTGNPNGVWNLVLACRDCNRGAGGKFDCVPALELVSRLHRRNEFLITSHHPLRETLIAQTGATPALRVGFLQGNYQTAKLARIIEWNAIARDDAAF